MKKALIILTIFFVLSGMVCADSTGENLLKGLYKTLQITTVSFMWADYVSSAIIIRSNPQFSEGNRHATLFIDKPLVGIPITVGISYLLYAGTSVMWESESWFYRALGFAMLTILTVRYGSVLGHNFGVVIRF